MAYSWTFAGVFQVGEIGEVGEEHQGQAWVLPTHPRWEVQDSQDDEVAVDHHSEDHSGLLVHLVCSPKGPSVDERNLLKPECHFAPQ